MLWAAEHHNVDFTAEVMERALAVTADDHAFNPAQDRLRALADKWDGVSRLTTWLADYLNVELTLANRKYLAEIGAAWLKGVAARVLFPGCKRDDVLVLVGPQGFRKSTAASAIADCICPRSFTDSLGNLGSDEASIGIIGITIAEFSELSAIARSELEAVKAFVSRSSDRFRERYAQHQTDHPRTCSFIATTNEDCGFLRDPSGNRRWWPVTITTQIDSDQLACHLPQLLGEAARRVIDGEPWYVTDAVALAQADEIREDNSDRDVWEAAVLAAMDVLLPHERTIAKALDYIGVKVDRQDRQAMNRVSGILRANGWRRKRGRVSGGGLGYVWHLFPSCNKGEQDKNTIEASQKADCSSVPIYSPYIKNNYVREGAGGVKAENAGESAGDLHRGFDGNKGNKGNKSPPAPDSPPVGTPPSAETNGGDPDISPDIASASSAENPSSSGCCKAKAADTTRDNPHPSAKPLSPLDQDIMRYMAHMHGTATDDEVYRQTRSGATGRTLPLVRRALHHLVALGLVDKVNGVFAWRRGPRHDRVRSRARQRGPRALLPLFRLRFLSCADKRLRRSSAYSRGAGSCGHRHRRPLPGRCPGLPPARGLSVSVRPGARRNQRRGFQL